jgi:nitrous oxidase accessory protein NosD
MKSVMKTSIVSFGLGIFICGAGAEAKNINVACGPKKTIQSVIPKLKPGDAVLVSGTCSEDVDIPSNIARITIDGQSSATLNGTDAADGALRIRGTDIVVKNLTVTGPANGIQVHRGGTALIDSVTVQGAGNNGIVVNSSSFARIVNSSILDNEGTGIVVTENSSARIGFLMNSDTAASPNTITGNARGITVAESSSAVIIGNNISNNASDGILVNTVSHADIAGNTINANVANGINFGRNSGVDLGADSGSGIFESPNSTTVNNGEFGLRCFINSYGDRRLGSLNGASGAKDFPAGCIDSTL